MTGKILIVDDVATNRIVLKVKLSAAQYQTIMAEDGNQALALARRMQPDLILMDVLMPGRSGLMSALSSRPTRSHQASKSS